MTSKLKFWKKSPDSGTSYSKLYKNDSIHVAMTLPQLTGVLVILRFCSPKEQFQPYAFPLTVKKPQTSMHHFLYKNDVSADFTNKPQLTMDYNVGLVGKDVSACLLNPSSFLKDSSQDSEKRDLSQQHALQEDDFLGDLTQKKLTFIDYNDEHVDDYRSASSVNPASLSEYLQDSRKQDLSHLDAMQRTGLSNNVTPEKQNFIDYHGGPVDEYNTACFVNPLLVKPADKYTEQPSFPVHSIISVTVLEFNDPTDISFIRNDLYFTCSFIENEIVKWYKDIAVVTKTFRCSAGTLKPGTPVVFLLLGVCKRAMVTNIDQDGDFCDVTLVDYGLDYAQVKISQLTKMSATHAAYPPLFARLTLNIAEDNGNVAWKKTSLEKWRESNLKTSDEVDLKMRGYLSGDLMTRDAKQYSLKKELEDTIAIVKFYVVQKHPEEVSALHSATSSSEEPKNSDHTSKEYSSKVDSKRWPWLTGNVKSRRFPGTKPSSPNSQN